MVTDEEQFDARYMQANEIVDKLRDAVLVPGPSLDEHRQALLAVNEACPTFFMDWSLTMAGYQNNQVEQVDEPTLVALTSLVKESGEDAMEAAQSVGHATLVGAINDAGIYLRKSGRIQWVDHTPDE
jgi:hypothetical protein